MKSIGQQIKEARKSKGFSQEKLAELSSLNMRTIQRIEANENEPRKESLKNLCEVLSLDFQVLNKQVTNTTKPYDHIVNYIFLILLNILMMFTIGYLTIDSEANLNSRIGAFLLSILIPYVIVTKTHHMRPIERILKFGSGFILYIILANIITEFGSDIVFLLTPFLLIALAILFYGKSSKYTMRPSS